MSSLNRVIWITTESQARGAQIALGSSAFRRCALIMRDFSHSSTLGCLEQQGVASTYSRDHHTIQLVSPCEYVNVNLSLIVRLRPR